MHSGWRHHYNLSLPTRQHRQLNSRDAGHQRPNTQLQSRTLSRVPLEVLAVPIYRGAQAGELLYVPDVTNNREGPQAREPSKCLNRRSYGERLAEEAS